MVKYQKPEWMCAAYVFGQQVKRWHNKHISAQKRLTKKNPTLGTTAIIGFGVEFKSWVNFGVAVIHPWKNLILIQEPQGRGLYTENVAGAKLEGKNTVGPRSDRFWIETEERRAFGLFYPRWETSLDYYASLTANEDLSITFEYEIHKIRHNEQFKMFMEELKTSNQIMRNWNRGIRIYKINHCQRVQFLDLYRNMGGTFIGSIKSRPKPVHETTEQYNTFKKFKDAAESAYENYARLQSAFVDFRIKNGLSVYGEPIEEGRVEFSKSDQCASIGCDGEYEDDYGESDSRHLYLMKCCRTNHYKIGIGKNPTQRESTLQNEKPDMKLVGQWRGLSNQEKNWHRYFEKQRVRGEWFALSPAQVRFFCSVCAKGNQAPQQLVTQ